MKKTESPDSETFRTLRRKCVLDRAPFLQVEEHRIRLPDGRTIPDWTWIETPDFVSILAATEDQRFLFFRQYKYALRGRVLAPPGGFIEPGERPLTAARRELREETGCVARTWQKLGRFRIDANRGVGHAHLYLAHGTRRIADPTADDLEPQELCRLSRRDLETALDAGRIPCLPWAALVVLGLRRMDPAYSPEMPTRPLR